jgi:hypothetical protein
MSKPHRGSRYLLNKVLRSRKHLNIQWFKGNNEGFHSFTPKRVNEQETESSD